VFQRTETSGSVSGISISQERAQLLVSFRTIKKREEAGPLQIMEIVFSNNGRTLTTIDNVGHVQACSLVSESEQQNVDLPVGPYGVRAAAFGVHATLLAIDGPDNSIWVKDLVRREERQLQGHKDSIVALSFGCAGRELVSSDMSGEVRFWDLRTG